MMADALAEQVAAIRHFNRFYTREIGVLHEGLLQSPFSLAEGRVIYELAQRETTTARALAAELRLDPGYLSRILKRFAARKLIARQPDAADARQNLISLTATGRAAFAALDRRSAAEVAEMLVKLPDAARARLVAALTEAETLLGGRPEAEPKVPYLLRTPAPGDMGWIVHRQGLLYARDYHWDETFEALVAEIVAAFVRNFDAKRERCWIAEREGAIVGSVFVVRESDEVAKLRLLYVEAEARGLGIGRRLVDECLRFARFAGYRRITLWTNDILTSARRIYEATGFRLVDRQPHHSFGHDLIGQNWEREV